MRYGNDDSNVDFELIITEFSYISLCNKRMVINLYYKVIMDLCHLPCIWFEQIFWVCFFHVKKTHKTILTLCFLIVTNF